jgi:hypothetical protein
MRLLAWPLPNWSIQIRLARHVSTKFGPLLRKHRDGGGSGGQNLSERYVRLAKSLKGKDAYLGGFNVPSTTPNTPSSHEHTILKSSPGSTFHGFTIPDPPAEPSSEGLGFPIVLLKSITHPI